MKVIKKKNNGQTTAVKFYPIKQSIDQSRLETWNIDRRHWDEIYRTKPFDLDLDVFSQGKIKKVQPKPYLNPLTLKVKKLGAQID